LAIREILNHTHENDVFFAKYPLISSSIMALVVGTLLGYLAPFGTNTLGFYKTIIYWQILIVTGSSFFLPILYFGEKYLRKFKLYYSIKIISLLVIAAILMSFIVTFVTILFFSLDTHYMQHYLTELPRTFIVGLIITLLFQVKSYIKYQKAKLLSKISHLSENKVSDIDKFMNKLPLAVRGKLLCFEMADHYLKIHTNKGNHMLLMRLKDAMQELENYQGLQTHRSWWVAENAVVTSLKDKNKTFLKLENDQLVPVSKTFLPLVKSKNLL